MKSSSTACSEKDFLPRMSFHAREKTVWYILYTLPHAEKLVQTELVKMNYEVFLPMIKTLRIWKNRQKKRIDQVLFPSYIFVYTFESRLYEILRLPKIVTCIQCDGKPSIISPQNIESIKLMLNHGSGVTVETKFKEGEKVRIISGALAGREGILINQKGRTRFGIQFKEINHTVLIDVSINALEKI